MNLCLYCFKGSLTYWKNTVDSSLIHLIVYQYTLYTADKKCFTKKSEKNAYFFSVNANFTSVQPWKTKAYDISLERYWSLVLRCWTKYTDLVCYKLIFTSLATSFLLSPSSVGTLLKKMSISRGEMTKYIMDNR